MSELKCPFCKEELSYAQEIDGGFEILTCDCPHGIWLFGNDKMWYNLEKAITELEHTRKALDVANEKLKHCVNMTVEELDELKGNLLIAWNALLHFSKDPIANNALKKITALEQKDVK